MSGQNGNSANSTTKDSSVFLHFIEHLACIYGALFNKQFGSYTTIEYAMRVYRKALGDLTSDEAERMVNHILHQRDDKYPPNLKELVEIRRLVQPRKQNPALTHETERVDPDVAKAFIDQLYARIRTGEESCDQE